MSFENNSQAGTHATAGWTAAIEDKWLAEGHKQKGLGLTSPVLRGKHHNYYTTFSSYMMIAVYLLQ
jgi:hypothetical protein